MKAGTVALIGRPNVGKSTLVNSIIGQKVSITSPKPQTTRFPIQAVYNDERGQIIFIDLPGLLRKTRDPLSKKVNRQTLSSLKGDVDIFVYVVDHTRKRDFEESRVVGIMRKIKKPKILVVNKIEIEKPTYLPLYKFLEDEFEHTFQVSALSNKHIKPLLDQIFAYLPEREPLVDPSTYTFPGLNLDSKTFLSEIIREKVFLKTRKEVPYTTTVIVDEIIQRENDITYIKARILTTEDRYKKILIGKGGHRIKEIGTMARKELELATSKKIYLDLEVEVDKHWVQTLT